MKNSNWFQLEPTLEREKEIKVWSIHLITKIMWKQLFLQYFQSAWKQEIQEILHESL